MQKYAIVFDVDGVITDSAGKKYEAFFAVMKKYNIENHPEISRLLETRVNRLVLANAVFSLFGISQDEIFREIGNLLQQYESPGCHYPLIKQVGNFIKNHSEDFVFFTNSSMQKKTIEHILESFHISQYFTEIFSYDSGTKLENIQKIISQFGFHPENILFIDDLNLNIDAVSPSGVHCLLFDANAVDLEAEVSRIFG